MFSIRQGMFETNSSSCHSFLISKDCSASKIPTSIKLKGSTDPTTQEGRIRFLYDQANMYGYGRDFVEYLMSKGVQIEDFDIKVDFSDLCNRFGIDEQQLDLICFGNDVISEYQNEYDKHYMDRENYEHVDIER